jgi:hypothetical protein
MAGNCPVQEEKTYKHLQSNHTNSQIETQIPRDILKANAKSVGLLCV